MSDAVSVNVAWSNVMESVRSVGKGDYNEDQGFRFRGVDSVVNAVGPALREHNVSVIPKRIVNTTEYETRRGTRMVNKEVTVEWEVRGPGGDSFTGEAIGEAADAGDKAVSKAQSVSYRVFLLTALSIPTGNPDPDSETHERVSAATPSKTPTQLARERLWEWCAKHKQSAKEAEARFAKEHGYSIKDADPATIDAFGQLLEGERLQDEAQDAEQTSVGGADE
jgi:hypothetical protein